MQSSSDSPLSHLLILYKNDMQQFFYDLSLCRQCLKKYGSRTLVLTIENISDESLRIVLLRLALRQKNSLLRIRSLLVEYLVLYPESVARISVPQNISSHHTEILTKTFGSFVFSHPYDEITIEGSQGYMMRSFSHDVDKLLA